MTLPTGSGVWRLEPFAMEGGNAVELIVGTPEPGAKLEASVRGSDGGAWTTITEKKLAPAEPGRVKLEFDASGAIAPVTGGPVDSLSSEDRSAISGLLSTVRGFVAEDPDSAVLSHFERWLEYHQELTGRARSDLESIVLETLIDLADPELSLASTGGADLRLVCGGRLCFPVGADGRPALRADADDGGNAWRLVLSRSADGWSIVA